ncbi:amino acid adenylation domain-containing protein [Halalkalibacterium halodurans]|uniref:non-ribosomal peptide synthetase n=1 Tax=Halalkalibacterium halodurans TaxID=86665 RepID=UPI001067A3A9|nr:non-ribosomal peptide synthetase [Halalkalibacterium halodurans]TES55744.1 amino acid adenylation domain-containing protein [Halalkalibacterium halodurans]
MTGQYTEEVRKKREILQQYFQSNEQSANRLYPLSSGQETLWCSHYISENQNHLNMFSAWKLPHHVRIDMLEKAFQYLVDKYETLRTNYMTVKGSPYQYIHENHKVNFRYEDLSHLSRVEFDKRLSGEAHASFDIEKDPLLKIRVYKNHADEQILLFNVHHLAIDGWSITILLQELGEMYSRLVSAASPIRTVVHDTYRQFVREDKQRLKEQGKADNPIRKYWSERIREGGGLQPVNLPSLKNTGHSYKGEPIFSRIEEDLCTRLYKLAKDNKTTVYNVLLASLHTLLYRYTGQENIWVSTPFSRRGDARCFDSVGYYVNTLHIHGRFHQEVTFHDMLAQISNRVKEVFKYQDISNSFFTGNEGYAQGNTNVIFSFQNLNELKESGLSLVFLGIEGAKGNVGPLQIEVYPLKRRVAQFEVELEVVEHGKEMYFRLLYDPEKYDAHIMQRICSHYVNLLSAITSDQHRRITDYQFLNESDVVEQLHQYNHSELIRPSESNTILQLIEEVALVKPNAIAVVRGQDSITYTEILQQAEILANNLHLLGIESEDRVGLCMNTSADLMIGIVGILKAGAVYVPLDPAYPAGRIDYMINDSDISLIITDQSVSALNDVGARKVFLQDLLIDQAAPQRKVGIQSNQLAYMIYTSGSTGKPKGVMVSHGNLYASTYARRFAYEEDRPCRFILLSSISFDSSLVGIFWTLSIGGTIIIPEIRDLLDINELIKEISNHKATHFLSVPSLAHVLLSRAHPEKIRSLETIIVAGEQFPSKLQAYQQDKYPNLKIYNEYGPTEGTVWGSVHRLNDITYPIVPIGKPAKHCKLYIFDDALNLVPKGVVGELFIAGSGVTRGYINQPRMTAERFIPNPYGDGERLYRTGDLAKYNHDGTIQFIGRKDNQIKVNGFRIELGEIEATYERHPVIQKAVVINKKDQGAQIVAFIKCSDHLSQEQLKEYGSKHLPHYLIPHYFVSVEEYPLSQNGKIDRKRLREWEIDRIETDTVLPRNEVERKLVDIFKQVLRIEQIGVNDNFFEMGGDSIIAIQIASKASEEGLTLKPKDIFESRTIARIAQQVLNNSQTVYEESLDINGDVPLTPIQQWFFEQKFNYPNHWNQAIHLKIDKTLPFVMIKEAMEAVIGQHEALHMRFMYKEGEWIQKYMPDHKSVQIINIKTNHTHPNAMNSTQDVATSIGSLQQALDLQEGPTVLAALLENDKDSLNNDFIIIIHHLLVDIVSWQIIMTDFERILNKMIEKEKIDIQHKTASYKRWSTHLIESLPLVLSESSYWNRVNDAVAVYGGSETITGSEGSTVKMEMPLGTAETEDLLQEVPKYFGTQLNEVVLAAIVLSLKAYTQRDGIVIDIEHHGRVPFNEEAIDVSKTVGWFTNIYPIYLDLQQIVQPNGDLLKHVKNKMREVPHSGLGYGMLRYLQAKGACDESQSEMPRARFSYNFLGQIDHTFFHSRYFTFSGYLSESVRDPNEKRPYFLDFEPYISAGNFVLRIGYSKDLVPDSRIQRLAEETIEHLKSLITLCKSSEEIGYVSGDFPNANIGQKELEKFLSHLKNH